MLNSIAIQGRLVHTPEAKVTKSSKDVCTFSIACDRQSGGQKETDFFNRTATEIMANKVDFCGGKSDSKPADRAQDAPQNYSRGNADDFSVIDDDGSLPF